MRPAAPGSRAACTVSSICDASSLLAARAGGFHTDTQAVGALCNQRGIDEKP